MPVLNDAKLMGYMTRDPERKELASGAVVANFSIGVTKKWRDGKGEMQEKTAFVPVTVWMKQAENLVKYCGKGSLILVEGEISQDNWEDDNGNKRSKLFVTARVIQYIKTKGGTAEGGGQEADGPPDDGKVPAPESPMDGHVPEEFDSSDVPF